MEEAVRQGFICPFCMSDLGDFPRLAAHVETAHPERTESDIAETVVQNFKDFFDMAKRGIKKIDARSVVDFSQVNASVSASVADVASMVTEKVQEKGFKVAEKPKPTKPPQPIRRPVIHIRPEIGTTRAHKEYFMQCRDSSVNETAVLTNTLIIRLDRLINECPSDPTRRREFERSVVPWSADSESPLCRCCAAKFGLTRRRHHCRLCGRVMCHSCSRHLSFLSARKLTSSASIVLFDQESEDGRTSSSPSHGQKLLEVTQKTTEKMKLLFESTVSRMSGDGSSDQASLGSLLQQDAEEHLRVCPSCLQHLQKREQMMEQSVAPAIVEQYATLDRLITEVTSLAPNYVRMATSLNNGETMYTLKAADELKGTLLRKQKNIDDISQKLLVGDGPVGPKEMLLRRNIRIMAQQSLQNLIGSLVSLPTKEQYEKLVEQHKQEIARQIEEARRRAVYEQQRPLKPSNSMPVVSGTNSTQSSPKPSVRHIERKTADEGWTPQNMASHNPFMEDADRQHPLKEQWDIIRSYLSQAAAAGRTDEVDMLERNLRDLEDEMRHAGLDPHH